MDRNSIIGIVLIFVILIVFGKISKNRQEAINEVKQAKDTMYIEPQAQDTQKVTRQEPVAETPIQKNVVAAPETKSKEDMTNQYGVFARAATGEQQFITLENSLLIVKISTKGGRPYSAELKDYKTYDSLPLILFDGDSSIFGLDFFAQNKTISTNNLFFTPDNELHEINASDETKEVRLKLKVDDARYIEYVYSLKPNSYLLDFKLNLVGMQDIIAQNLTQLDLNWEIYSPKHEKGRKNENYYTTLYYKPFGDDVEYFNARSKKEIQEEDIDTRVKWIAFKGQFFSSAIIAENAFENASVKYTDLPDNETYLKKFRTEIGLPFTGSTQVSYPMHLYLGPNKFSLLKKKYGDIELHDMVTVGRSIIKWINQFVIIKLFDFLSKYFHNYGLIIFLLTIIIKIGLFPLTYRSYLSQAKMRVLKPQIDEINKKIPKEKAMERQQATMALYKKAGVSPMGGCLPMLLQMPILFAMFRFFPTSIELRQQSFLWAKDLSTYDAVIEWSGNIPLITNLMGNHISLFTVLMTLSTVLTMRFSSQSTAGTQQMPGMKGMMYIMPVMFMFILNSFSAALTYYYFLANIITFVQNLISKQFVDEEALLKKMEAKKTKPKKKSKFQARMEELAKQRGYKPPKKK